MMTDAEKLEHLKSWEKTIKDSDAFLESVESIFGGDESKMHQAIWELQTELTRKTSTLVGDSNDWLGWYQFDTQWGARDMEVKTTNHGKRLIKTLEDLLWAINQ